MRVVHCSWDRLEPGVLVPRVPKTTITGPNVSEDCTIPRICVAKSVQDALASMPRTGEVIKQMQKFGLPLVIHAYYLTVNEVYKPTPEQVPDAEETGELWLLSCPVSVRRRDYLIMDPVVVPYRDQNRNVSDQFFGCELKQTRFQSNFTNFLQTFSGVTQNADKLRKIVSFRNLMLNLDDEIVQELENRRRL